MKGTGGSSVPRRLTHAVVTALWSSRTVAPAHSELRLPTGATDIVLDVSRGRAVVAGPTTRPRPFAVHPARDLIGAELAPGHAAILLGVPLDGLRDRQVPLEAIWGDGPTEELLDRLAALPGPALRRRALASALAERITRLDRDADLLAARIASRIRSDPADVRINELPELTGRSGRRLEQVARQELGMSMKRYQRLHRFRRALTRVDDVTRVGWSGLASEAGYSDQAHFVHEFRVHAGMTPTAYLRARGAHVNHVASLSSKTPGGHRSTLAPEVMG